MSKNANRPVKELIAAARKVRRNAHAPYSKFKVGAALITAQGDIFVGANVENASYPEGICAEGSAIAAMVAAGQRRIHAIAIAADADISPCGGCRQKIAEFSTPQTLVIMTGTKGAKHNIDTAGALLPRAFQMK